MSDKMLDILEFLKNVRTAIVQLKILLKVELPQEQKKMIINAAEELREDGRRIHRKAETRWHPYVKEIVKNVYSKLIAAAAPSARLLYAGDTAAHATRYASGGPKRRHISIRWVGQG